jgi:glyoxylase-like metal-dependent hydrolase (beta-lactamase superfamily II)
MPDVFHGVLFRQLYDATSSTYSYLLADPDTKEAVLIDPVFERHLRDAALIRELGLKLVYTLDTHCHADHVTGAWLMKQSLGSRIGLAAVYGATQVDQPLQHGDTIHFGASVLEVRATPGHTAGCLSFVTTDHGMVFTGDALLVRGAGRTDFQQGDARTLFRSIHEQLFTLPDSCVLFPGHDYEGRTSSTIGEEKAWNPRIGGAAREVDFVGYMQNLGLPHPKQMAVAVPANMHAGKPENAPASDAGWGPVVTTFAGLWEIAPEWVASHLADVNVVDVRSAEEFDGELGHLPGARLIPLDELRGRLAEVKDDKPVVLVCQTGKRSAMATVILKQAGLKHVANLAGGMVRWRELLQNG